MTVNKNLIVTGTTGFIGSALKTHLDKNENYNVIYCNRKDTANLHESNESLINFLSKQNNIDDKNDSYFIHVAHDFSNQSRNVLMLKNILDTLYNNNSSNSNSNSSNSNSNNSNSSNSNKFKFIFISSWVVLYDGLYDDKYTKSKRDCEKLLKDYGTKYNFPYFIVRPAVVIGNKSKFNPFLKPLSWISQSLYISHVSEVVDTIVNLCTEPNIEHENRIVYPPAHQYDTGQLTFLSRLFQYIIPSSFWFLYKVITTYPNLSSNNVSLSMLAKNQVVTTADIKWASKYLSNIKCVGTNLTTTMFNQPVDKNQSLVFMNTYNRILFFDEEQQQITVQSGCLLIDVLEFLEKHQLTLSNIPEFCNLSVAACLTTQVHGSSIYSSCTASNIIEYEWMDKNGNCVTITSNNDNTSNNSNNSNIFSKNKNSIIITVTFQAIPLFQVQRTYKQYKIPQDESALNFIEKHIKNRSLQEHNFNTNTITYGWIQTNPYELFEWNISLLNKYSKLNADRPVHYMRRHSSYFRINFKGWDTIEQGTYTKICNQYLLLPFEKFIMQLPYKLNLWKLYRRGNKEFYCPISRLRQFFNELKGKNVKSIGFRFTKQDHIIYFPDYPDDVICWIDIVYSGTEFMIDNFDFHNGKNL